MFLHGLHLRLLLLLLLTEAVHLLRPWIVGVLLLEELLLGLLHLVEARLLRLVVSKPVSIPILSLEASRLAVDVVHEAGLLGLLLLANWVAEPIHCGLLLIALIEARRLRGLFGRCIVKEQVALLLILKLALPQFVFLPAQLDSLSEVIIGLWSWPSMRSARRIFLSLVLRGFDRKAVFEVVVFVSARTLAIRTALRTAVAKVGRTAGDLFKTCHAGLP